MVVPYMRETDFCSSRTNLNIKFSSYVVAIKVCIDMISIPRSIKFIHLWSVANHGYCIYSCRCCAACSQREVLRARIDTRGCLVDPR